MKLLPLLSLAALSLRLCAAETNSSVYSTNAIDPKTMVPTKEEKDARLGWWREARFGMFVHFGAYSPLSGNWDGKQYKGYGEHIQRMAKIPCPVYRKEVVGKFNPSEFNADEWIRLAKEAGMGYFVITAKHHDGFAMYDSKVSDYNIVKATPFQHDIMRDLKAACQKYGLKFGFYYSHAFDWGEENGPGNDWDYNNPGGDKLLNGKDWWIKGPEFLPKAHKYVDEKAIPQIQELIANYDPDILWFDTPHKLPPWENLRILAAVRKAKTSLVVNGRLINGLGDYASTCDRPAEFPPHSGDWEAIPTTNESYGYNANDRSHKPASHFIRILAKAVARGGNVLMNVGPMGNGKIDEADQNILKGIGSWWKVNGSSIRGCDRTPLAVQAWGESTRKGDTLYLHVFEWPKDGELVVGGLKTEVVKAYLLAAPNTLLKTTQKGLDLGIAVPAKAPDSADSVVVLECKGEPVGDKTRLLSPTVPVNVLRGFDAELKGPAGMGFGDGKPGDAYVLNWTSSKQSVVWPVRITEKTTFDVALVYSAPGQIKEVQKIQGDAGAEEQRSSTGCAGNYIIAIGDRKLSGTVQRDRTTYTEKLGRVTLEPGTYDIQVLAAKITGQELMRLRRLELTPVPPTVPCQPTSPQDRDASGTIR